MSDPKSRRFKPIVVFGLIMVAAMVAVSLAEPGSIPYRLTAGLTGAIFGAIGGGLGAALAYLIQRRFTAASAGVGVVLGFMVGQLVEQSATSLGDRVFDTAVRPHVDRALIRRNLSEDVIFQKVKEIDATAYEQLVNGVVDRVVSGGTAAQIKTYTQQYVADFRRRNAERALSASSVAMAALIRSLRDIVVYLESVDPAVCKDYVFGGPTAPLVRAVANRADFLRLLQNNAVAVFAAIADGKARNLTHATPTDADVEALAQLLDQAGWTLEMREALASPDRMRQLSPSFVCRWNREWLSVLLSIRDEGAQGRWYREILGPLLRS